MIQSVRHSALRRFLQRDDSSRLPPERLRRIKAVLQALSFASEIADIATIPGAHRLRGDRAGQWSVPVSSNWRIVFRFENGDVWDVDLEDYH